MKAVPDMDDASLSRRQLLQLGAVGATVLALPFAGSLSAAQASELPASAFPRPFTVDFRTPSVLQPTGTLDGRPLYVLTQRAFRTQVLPGVTTTLWGYNGEFPGPTIRVRQNTRSPSGRSTGCPCAIPSSATNRR